MMFEIKPASFLNPRVTKRKTVVFDSEMMQWDGYFVRWLFITCCFCHNINKSVIIEIILLHNARGTGATRKFIKINFYYSSPPLHMDIPSVADLL